MKCYIPSCDRRAKFIEQVLGVNKLSCGEHMSVWIAHAALMEFDSGSLERQHFAQLYTPEMKTFAFRHA